MTIARTVKSDCETTPTWLASVHAHASKIPKNLLATNPHRDVEPVTRDGSLWELDLIPFELHQLFLDESYIWGGDLNSAGTMDDVPNFLGGNRKLRQMWLEAGSVDLRTRWLEQEQQTFFRPGNRAYQIDHLFSDAATESRVTAWSVDRRPVEVEPPLSDHAPVIVELE